jgi:hypothetical protein
VLEELSLMDSRSFTRVRRKQLCKSAVESRLVLLDAPSRLLFDKFAPREELCHDIQSNLGCTPTWNFLPYVMKIGLQHVGGASPSVNVGQLMARRLSSGHDILKLRHVTTRARSSILQPDWTPAKHHPHPHHCHCHRSIPMHQVRHPWPSWQQ